MARIAFLVNDLTVVGGSTKVTYQLANQWSKHHQVKLLGLFQSQSHFPFLLETSVPTQTLYKKSCQIHELKTYFYFLKTGQWKPCFQLIQTLIYLWLNRSKVRKKLSNALSEVEVVVIPDVHGLLFLPSEVLKEKKIVVHLHNTVSFLSQNPMIMKTLLRFQSDIDQFVLLTQHDAQSFQQLGFHQSTFIYNEVQLPQHILFPRSQPQTEKVVFLGRLDSRKGVECLVPLMKELLIKRPQAELHIYGDGPERVKLKKAIQEARLQEQITLHGHTTSLDEVFQEASCFWLTSKWEGLPLTLLEAFAYGVPAVAFRCFDGIEEIILQGQNGYIVSPSNLTEMVERTEQLLSQPYHWEEVGQRAREQVSRFAATTIHQEWEMFLQQLLSNQTKREAR